MFNEMIIKYLDAWVVEWNAKANKLDLQCLEQYVYSFS